jgi:hypothetical protein
VLKKENWDCAEAVELTLWRPIFLENSSKIFSPSAIKSIKKPLPDLLSSICQLRHTAVHRVRLPASSILDFILDAEDLAGLLQDSECGDVLFTLRRRTQDTIATLERERRVLLLKIAEFKRLFAEKRKELLQQEKEILDAVVQDGESRMLFASVEVEKTLDAPCLIRPGKMWEDDVHPDKLDVTQSQSVGEPVLEPQPESVGVRLLEEVFMIKPLRLLPRS